MLSVFMMDVKLKNNMHSFRAVAVLNMGAASNEDICSPYAHVG